MSNLFQVVKRQGLAWSPFVHLLVSDDLLWKSSRAPPS